MKRRERGCLPGILTGLLAVMTLVCAALTWIVLMSWGGAGLFLPFALLTVVLGGALVVRLRRQRLSKALGREPSDRH